MTLNGSPMKRQIRGTDTITSTADVGDKNILRWGLVGIPNERGNIYTRGAGTLIVTMQLQLPPG